MHCLRRASWRLLSSSLASNAVATSRSRAVFPIRPTAAVPKLSPIPCPFHLQVRWHSSETEEPKDSNPYSQEPTESPVATNKDGISKRELRHRLLDNATNPPSETIYVGNLFYDLTAEDLRKKMEEFGIVLNTLIIYDSRGLSKGFGYVQFSSIEEATKAIEKQHMQVLEGRQTVVHYARGQVQNKEKHNAPSKSIFIGDIPYQLTDRDLQELFKDVKGCYDVRFPVDRRSGLPRGFAHADFFTEELAAQGIEVLSRKAPYGRKLRVNFAEQRAIGTIEKQKKVPVEMGGEA